MPQRIYVDGEWLPASGGAAIQVVNPATEEPFDEVPRSGPKDVARAVEAAAAALPAWSARPVTERAGLCAAVAAALGERADELTETIVNELGMPIKLTRAIQVGSPIRTFMSMPEVAAAVAFEEPMGSSVVYRDPVGVVGAITPWNYPLHQIAAKVAPALTAGCTVVLKPSEVTPLDAFVLAEVMHEVGIPAGVFNVVSGTGPEAGEALAAHPLVDMVSFTGSTRAGRRVAELAAAGVRRTALELGGKSANVLLDDLGDAAFEDAVRKGVAACYLNSGQTCSALTRLLVPRERLQDAERIAADEAVTYTPGDPRDPATRLGPLVSAVQRERVRAHLRAAAEDGATILTGGPDAPDGLERGYYVRPTVITAVTPESRIAQEEIFGPVLVILPYDGEDEAVRIANGTPYGLAAGVRAADQDRARRVARRLRAGQIRINDGAHNGLAPFGGFKQSGYGREYGRFGLEEFLTTTSVQL
ncbi:aldehyde dehydrogenase (NAD+)/betaine-aldehyde dehydrogenase [Nonomuraea thailandensis]|uniref:aldehyde dehydrogenase (NAD(+)) n=1 Tax=Nonomuraea thailandensis TaxID=1188745 RepID=A0A9X2K1X6_9ACTN|nr:aldehyde dehydrogenase family protein [Nonomuraea thailandensis]MCP2356784.1 aldehyde dehydrogenase (NAD+)/betaine-aldehyde dehydrogenase [Nonomuraea thailandensis]